jgi:hypothetical protein
MRVAASAAALVFALPVASIAEWAPEAFAEEDVLEFFSVNEAGEEHWATVWFVVIDGDAYVRLGGRAERRMTENVNAPIVKVRIADEVFDDITAEEAPDMVSEVVELMREKYWSAMFMGWMPERYTARLTRKPAE